MSVNNPGAEHNSNEEMSEAEFIAANAKSIPDFPSTPPWSITSAINEENDITSRRDCLHRDAINYSFNKM